MKTPKPIIDAVSLLGSVTSLQRTAVYTPPYYEILKKNQFVDSIAAKSTTLSNVAATFTSVNNASITGCTTILNSFKYTLDTSKIVPGEHLTILQKTIKTFSLELACAMPNLCKTIDLPGICTLECEVANALKNSHSGLAITLPSLQIAEALQTLTALSDSILKNVDATLASTQLISGYSRLVQKQYSKVLKGTNNCEKHLKIVDLATSIVQQQISSVNSFSETEDIEFEDTAHESIVTSSKSAVQFIPSYLGYAFKEGTTYDLDEEYAKSMICKILSVGKVILEKIEHINEICMATGKEMLFKPTNKAFSIACCLSTSFSIDAVTFGNVVDSLYKIIYEGSGEAKRVLNVLTKEECEILWNIKHLRTDFRHDIEHGKENDYLKKKSLIANAYQDICGKIRPLKQKEWVTAHANLFDKTNDLLDLIIEKLSVTNN